MSFLGLLAVLAAVAYQPAVARLDLAPGAGGYPYCIGPKCENANPAAIEGPVGSITVQADEPPMPEEEATFPVCKNNTNRLDTTDCHHYFACVNGTHWVRKSCDSDQAFSPYLDICTRREYVPCHTHCNVDGKFKDDFNCHEFWVCVQKRPFKFRCANGTVYSESTGRCEEGYCKEDSNNNNGVEATGEPVPILVPTAEAQVNPSQGGASGAGESGAQPGESGKNEGSRPVMESCVCYGRNKVESGGRGKGKE